jgi:bacterioferritin
MPSRSTTRISARLPNGDNGTHQLLKSILVDEEEHIDWIEAQLDQIKQMGIQNYLVEQIG